MQEIHPVPPAPAQRLMLRLVADTTLIVFNLFLAQACLKEIQRTGSFMSMGLLVFNVIIVTLFITRREAKQVASAPLPWALAFAGTLSPILFRPHGASTALLAVPGVALQLFGLGLMLIAILSLRRSFGIVPANRGIQSGGMYRWVRHPLYAAELAFMLGFVLANPTAWNACIWVGLVGLQLARAHHEEALLQQDEAYRAYMRQVRHRLIPGVI